MKLFTLTLLLIATSQIVEAQSYRPAGGIDQPNEQFVREQMRRQAEQVNIDAAQRQQWDNIRTWRYINERRDEEELLPDMWSRVRGNQ